MSTYLGNMTSVYAPKRGGGWVLIRIRTNKNGLYFSELVDMWKGNRNVLDVAGWTFQVFLWSYLWMLAADENGVLHKEDVRRQYDGSLYYEIEKRRRIRSF